jgi:act minimal PKS acyl carrier protein
MTDFSITELRTVVRSCVGEHDAAEVDDSTQDREFADIGIDSLVVFEVATRLQDDWGIRISDEELEELRTPKDIVDLVNGKRAEHAR